MSGKIPQLVSQSNRQYLDLSPMGKQTLALTLGALVIGSIIGVAVGAYVSIGAGIGSGFGSALGVGAVGAMILGVRSYYYKVLGGNPVADSFDEHFK